MTPKSQGKRHIGEKMEKRKSFECKLVPLRWKTICSFLKNIKNRTPI